MKPKVAAPIVQEYAVFCSGSNKVINIAEYWLKPPGSLNAYCWPFLLQLF